MSDLIGSRELHESKSIGRSRLCQIHPNRPGIDNLVRSLQAQGRFTDRKVIFPEVADDRPATEAAKELGYKLP